MTTREFAIKRVRALQAQRGEPEALMAEDPGEPVWLEWRPNSTSVPVGSIVVLGLYGDANQDEPFVAFDAVIGWDPQKLELVTEWNAEEGRFVPWYRVGPYPWMIAEFPANDLDGYNDAWNGSALFTGWSEFASLPVITPDGMLLVQIALRLLEEPDTPTVVHLLSDETKFARTAVYDEELGGLNLVGFMGVALVSAGSSLPVCCDLDGDHDLDLRDFALLLPCWTGPK